MVKTKALDQFFKRMNNQSKRKSGSVDLGGDLKKIVHENYLALATETSSFEPLADNKGVCSAFDVNKRVIELIPIIENKIKDIVNLYPVYYWKYFTARFPREFFEGDLASTYIFSLSMFKSCISFSDKKIIDKELYLNGHQVLIPITEEVKANYFKLAGYSTFLKDLYVLLRTSSKGVNYRISPNSPVLDRIDDPDTIKAINLYDSRFINSSKLSSSDYIPSRSGFSLEQYKSAKGNVILVASESMEEKWDYIPKSFKKTKNKKRTLIKYDLIPYDLSTIYENFNKSSVEFPWNEELLEIIMILNFSSYCIKKGWVYGPDIYALGYFLLDRTFVEGALSSAIDQLNSEFKEKFNKYITLNSIQIINKFSKALSSDIYPGNAAIFLKREP
ncbi:hypothetical protein RT723_02075 [Psychrosphaera aquimarina]|uniref:Uncharacterized protein n=1 Tax=Psychrosphaera aquimarina TaxID=2044854 RepID=A0ABU3QXC9_9GAMM|nr:hypothetical protein [Psychrosphaera aquimarina]MDU0111815.1 hypothetical protein [Psychrosphaera aquimarina]